MKNSILFKKIEDKTIAWFEKNNKYVIYEHATANIVKQLENGVSSKDIATELSTQLDIPLEEALKFIKNLEKDIEKIKLQKTSGSYQKIKPTKKNRKYEYTYHYQINNTIIKIDYLSDLELSYVHPKFNHLTVENPLTSDHVFEVFLDKNFMYLIVDNILIGSWDKENIHYFQGKVSMEILQKIHGKEEKKWLGIFHASAVCNQKKAVLFLGDSGNGKSTSLALLQSIGFTCLADDFVPVLAKKREVYSFPSAISIKKNSLDILLPIYPELANSAEYNFKRLNKIVRYLKPNITNYKQHLPCKELVFIKYEKGSDFEFKEMSKTLAFQKLVPDSWLSPHKENAVNFLDWFDTLKCYELKYSDNAKMINAVKLLFKKE